MASGSTSSEFSKIVRVAIGRYLLGQREERAFGLEPSELYINCTTEVVQDTTNPVPPPRPPPPPRIETARLKEARVFLDDTKQFIAQQNSVQSISEIAKEAATLQLALNQFDERGAIESMQRLNDLLKAVSGFAEFEQQQQTKRNREEARQLQRAGLWQSKTSSSSIHIFRATLVIPRRNRSLAYDRR